MNGKIMSGKFIFALVTAGVFAYAAVTGLISSEHISAIIMIVVSFYFNKRQDEK